MTPTDDLIQALQGQGKGDIPSSAPNAASSFADELLEHHRQRRNHKRFLFWVTLLLAGVLLLAFGWLVGCSDRLVSLVKETPFALGIAALLGLIPTLILTALFKCVFHSPEKQNTDENSLEELKGMAGILKDLAAVSKELK